MATWLLLRSTTASDLLRRIINGERPTSDEATTVYALRSRLVVTRSAYAYSSAMATDAGLRVLAGGNPPAPPELDIDDEQPVPIPERVIRPHPLIAGLRHITVGYRGWIDTHRIPDVAHVRVHCPASSGRPESFTPSPSRRNDAATPSSPPAAGTALAASGSTSTDTCMNSPSSSTTAASRTC